MKKNEIAVAKAGFMNLKDFDLAELLSEEMAGLTGSFERIKIPAAGSTIFEIPGEDPNNPDTVKEFSAVIVHQHPMHAYYKNKYTGGSNPPDCGSYDGITGQGNPGGLCKLCPYNKFGTGENGSKACKNRRRMYLLFEGEIFPLLLSLPAGSLKGYTRYLMRLLGKGKKPNAVVTKFSLSKAVNSSGVVYSQAQFAADRDLTSDEWILVNSLSEQIKDLSNQVEYVEYEPDHEVDSETGEIVDSLE